MADDDLIPEPDVTGTAPHPRHTEVLFGQDQAEQGFLSAVDSGNLHHAWMLTGPFGVGKATLAWRMARYLLQIEDDGPALFAPAPLPQTLDLDPDSPIFRRTAAMSEPRLTLCRRPWNDKTKKLATQITVDEVRKLKNFFTLSAADGGWRVAIVDAADDMNTAAANALLKILEEPPEKVAIILVANQPGRLLPTIRSRCRTLALGPLESEDLSKALSHAGIDEIGDPVALHQITEGSVGRAVEHLGSDGEAIYQGIVATIATAPTLDRPMAAEIAEACTGRGAELRFALTRRLIQLALARLAKASVTEGGLPEAAPGERAMHQRLSAAPRAAVKWADLSQHVSERMQHAVSVNLDPGHVILDTFLQIEAVAAKTSV